MTSAQRQVEIFMTGCPLCREAIALVKRLTCSSCEVGLVVVHNLQRGFGETFSRARSYGVTTVPAVVVDGRLAECCRWPGVSEETLRQAGVGLA